MKLREIVKDYDAAICGDPEVDIKSLCHNTLEVVPGSMFFCLKGNNVDGHNFACEAANNGANVIVSERKLSLPEGVTNVVVGSSRKSMSVFASTFYGTPSKDMIIVSITGTNGKTTTSFMTSKIFEEAGKSVGVIGTNGIFINAKKSESGMTTPDPIELQKTLAKMRDEGVDAVFMEMSAHALFYQKNWGLMSDIAVFTNLTQDHLDFFGDMKNYGEAKKLLFSKNQARFAVLNADDEFSKTIIQSIDIPYISYSQSGQGDIVATNIKNNFSSQEFTVLEDEQSFGVQINLGGKFNVSNALAAITVAKLCGIDNNYIQTGLKKLQSVDGRFNVKTANGKKFIIDYAHTPDGLENILRASRELLPQGQGKLISVFGCGGNRDSLKRPIMGEISSRLADVSIITSDNPRMEKPEDIIEEIMRGVHKESKVFVEADRARAIKLASQIAGSDDLIVISGKGAENYMDIMGKKIEYSDSGVIDILQGGI